MTYAQMRVYEETRQKLTKIANKTGESVIALVDRLAEEEFQRTRNNPEKYKPRKEDQENV